MLGIRSYHSGHSFTGTNQTAKGVPEPLFFDDPTGTQN